MRKAISVSILFAACTLALASLTFVPGAGAGPDAAGAARPLRMTVGTLGSIGSLDPRHGDSVIAREVWNLQYPTLTTLDPKTLDVAPGLAGGWSPAPRGRGWIYNLRPALTWSDGQPVTAADVVYSFDHARDDHWQYAAGMLDGLTARALNEHSVEVTTSAPGGSFPGLLLHVVPEHVFSKSADVGGDVSQLGVSDGTWHVVATTATSVELDATTGATGPALQQIVFRTYPSADSLIHALAHGEVDVVSGIPDSDIGRLEALSKVTVDHAPDGTQYTLTIAPTGAGTSVLREAGVRESISLAIDRSQLVASVVNGVGTPTVVPALAIGASWALDDNTVQSLTASLDAQPQRARQLLSTLPKHTQLTFSAPTDPVGRRVGDYIRRALAAAGLETISAPDGDATPDLRLDHTTIGTDPTPALRSLTCDACAAKFRQFSTTSNYDTQLDDAHEMLEHATAQAFAVGLFEPDTLQAFRADNVTGFLPNPEQRSLVVFGPTVTQYAQLNASGPPPGEQSSNLTYAAGAVILLALCAAAYWIAALVRRRYAASGETHAS